MGSPSSTIALTGGTGFLGSHIAEALLAEGHGVRALARRPDDPGWLKGLAVELVPGDVRKPESLLALVRGASVVIHVAGKTSARSLDEYREANVGGVVNVLRACREAAPGAHVVLISSQAAAGPSLDGSPVTLATPPRPVSPYGQSKLEGENALKQEAGPTPFTILRPSAVYGPRETALRDLFVASSRGFVPLLAGGRPKVQMVYSGDVARAVLGTMARGGRGETFFVAHPEILDFRQVAETIARLRTPSARLLPVPAFVVRSAGAVVGFLSRFQGGPPVFNRDKAEEMLQPAWTCDVAAAEEALGSPFRTPFAVGTRLTNDWYREKGWIR